jgi:hypothetical protein
MVSSTARAQKDTLNGICEDQVATLTFSETRKSHLGWNLEQTELDFELIFALHSRFRAKQIYEDSLCYANRLLLSQLAQPFR